MDRKKLVTHAEGAGVLKKVPLVELAGRSRVLIENHLGVLAYSLEQIQIKVVYGRIQVSGCNLKIMQLSREQLIISGQIQTVELCGR